MTLVLHYFINIFQNPLQIRGECEMSDTLTNNVIVCSNSSYRCVFHAVSIHLMPLDAMSVGKKQWNTNVTYLL